MANENVITYPSRVWDGKSFVANVNREQSSDNLTTVAVKKNNEVLGFPDGISVDEMEHAIRGDQYGTISQWKPSFYERNIRAPLAKLGIGMFQPTFITEQKPTGERAFVTSFARGATADIIKPTGSDKEAEAFPKEAFAGQLAGVLVGFKGINLLLSGIKLPAFAGYSANILTGKMTQATKVTAGVQKSIQSGIQGGAAGGVYRGISETANEIRDEEHPEISRIGEAVLHDTLWWGGIGATVGPLSKYPGVAASTGLGYLMAKADGAGEADALLNGAVLGGFHLISGHGESKKVRRFAVENMEKNITDYVQTKNPMVDEQVAIQTGREFVRMKAEEVLPEYKGKDPLGEALKTPEVTQKLVENIGKDLFKTEKVSREKSESPADLELPEIQDKNLREAIYKVRKIEDLQFTKKSFEDSGKVKEAAKTQEIIDRIQMTSEEALTYENYRSGQAPVKETVPRFTGNKMTDEYAKEISGNPEKIKTLEDHITAMRSENEKLIKEDSIGDVVNRPRELRIQELNDQISLSGDILKKVKAEQEIPDFENIKGKTPTDAAIDFGEANIGNKELASKLRKNEKEFSQKSADLFKEAELMSKGQERTAKSEESDRLGLKGQLMREAADAVEGKGISAQRKKFRELTGEAGKLSSESGQVPPIEPPITKQQPIEGSGETKVRGLSKHVEEKAVAKKLTEGFGDLPEYKTVNIKEQSEKATDLLNKDYEQAKRIAMGEESPPQGILPESVFVAVENKAIIEGDVNTLRDLAVNSSLTTEATTMGQRIRTLGERNPESPTQAIKELQRMREEEYSRKRENYLLKGRLRSYVDKIGNLIKKDLSPEEISLRELNKIKREANTGEKKKLDDLLNKMGKAIKDSLKEEKQVVVKEIRSEIKKAMPREKDWNSFIKSLEC